MPAKQQKYKVTGKPSGGRGHVGKDAFRKESETAQILRQFIPFVLFIVALLLALSFFIKDFGAIGNFLRDKVFFGIFSVSLYFVPVFLVVIGWIMIVEKDIRARRKKVVCCIAAFLLVDVLCHLLFAGDAVRSIDPFRHYMRGLDRVGGGFIGGFIGGLLAVCFHPVGAFIIVAALASVLVMLAMRKTPEDALTSLTQKISDGRERRAALREEREISRRQAEASREKARIAAPKGAPRTEADAIAEEERRFAEQIAAFADEKEYGEYDNYDNCEYVDPADRRTEFDPTITDEDFPVEPKKTEEAPADAPAGEPIALEPVATAYDPDAEDAKSDISVFDDPDDEAVLDRLSKIYLGGDTLEVEEHDLDPTLSGGEVIDIPEEHAYVFPEIDLLTEDRAKKDTNYKRELETKEAMLIQTLEKFNVHTESAGTPQKGPTVTRYELRPAPGTRVRAIVNLVDDIALSLATGGIRIEAPIPGKSAVGIEVPNDERSIVRLRTLIDSDKFREADSILTVALGEDVAGAPVFFDLAKMPHLLVAGATNMGKSVCVNCMIVSLLYRARPDEVQFILIDPKRVEFNIYEGLPQLIVPVVTDPKKAAGALSWAVNEMERRFGLLEDAKVRNIAGYNELAAIDAEIKPLPRIVIIIDELADLMATAPDSVESSIARLAAKARAAGMHLIIGTQRPSVDVITGTIKNNIPSRIACTVASQIDSRTIIDMPGAEKLLGKGDILFNPVGAMKPIRVQGAFVDEPEILKIVSCIIDNNKEESGYDNDVINEIETEAVRCTANKRELAAMDASASAAPGGDEDPMFWRAVELAVDSGKISTSLIQRKCSLGFSRSAKLIDRMEEMGFVSAPDGQKPRQVLITRERLQEIKMGASADEPSADDGNEML